MVVVFVMCALIGLCLCFVVSVLMFVVLMSCLVLCCGVCVLCLFYVCVVVV